MPLLLLLAHFPVFHLLKGSTFLASKLCAEESKFRLNISFAHIACCCRDFRDSRIITIIPVPGSLISAYCVRACVADIAIPAQSSPARLTHFIFIACVNKTRKLCQRFSFSSDARSAEKSRGKVQLGIPRAKALVYVSYI